MEHIVGLVVLILLLVVCVLLLAGVGILGMMRVNEKSPDCPTIPLWTPPNKTVNEKIIASIRKEYPNAVITETADKIVVDFQITLLQPVKQIKISGVVEL